MALALALLAAAPAPLQPQHRPVGADEVARRLLEGHGRRQPVAVTYALVSNGTALMETLDGEHDVTMVTMYAPDGAAMLATHYCAVGQSAAHARNRLARREEPRVRVRGRLERGGIDPR